MGDAETARRTEPRFALALIRMHSSFQLINCTNLDRGFAGGAYGYVAMGPYQGGQAQYIRVPYADFNCLTLPAGKEKEADFILLADIFPTGWHGVMLSGLYVTHPRPKFGFE